MRARIPEVLRYGLAFAFIAALIVLQPLTAETYTKLFDYRSEQNLQKPVPEGYPVPESLIWRGATRSFIISFGVLPPAVMLGLAIVLILAGLYVLLRVLNPTFRMTTGVDWDKKLLTHTYMHTPPLIKAFLIAVTVFIPGFVLWHAIGLVLGQGWWSLWLRMALVGAAIWLLFSRDGVAGDYETGGYDLPREWPVRSSLLLRGALMGTLVWIAIRFVPVATPRWLMLFYRAQGGIGEAQWWHMVGLTLGFAALWGFALGGAAVALGRPAMIGKQRLQAAVLPLIVLLFTAWAGRYGLPNHYRERYDFDPGARLTPAQRMAILARLPHVPPQKQTILIVTPGGGIPVASDGLSSAGLPASRETAAAAEAFMKRRGYQTTLSYPAFSTMHDAASLSWNPVENLRLAFDNVVRPSPDPAFLPLFIDKLQFVPVTPEVIRYADRLAQGRKFHFQERESKVLMGDIYARLGQRERALDWYRRAELPGQQGPLRFEDPRIGRFAGGKVAGRILLDGKPFAGQMVGLMEARNAMNGPRLSQAAGGVPPNWLWSMSASARTDAQGRFTFEHLVQFAYAAMVKLPGDANSRDLYPVKNGPPAIVLNRQNPTVDLGTIEISIPR
jgi:hypothetical protein